MPKGDQQEHMERCRERVRNQRCQIMQCSNFAANLCVLSAAVRLIRLLKYPSYACDTVLAPLPGTHHYPGLG